MSLSSFYVSLTGLLSFSRGLDVVSDNIANLNTPGFRADDVFFRSLGPSLDASFGTDAPGAVLGFGSTVAPRGRRLTAGEIRSTGTAGNLAIDGAGFFILATSRGLIYTRAGQFQIQPSGLLVDPTTGGRVQAINGGRLEDLRIDVSAVSAAQPTQRVEFRGVLPVGSDTAQTVQNVTVVDADGNQRILSVTFTRTATGGEDDRVRIVSIKDADGNEIGTGRVEFDATGSPAPGFGDITLHLTAASGASTDVVFHFGDAGSLQGVTLNGTSTSTSTVVVSSNDGRALGSLAEFSFGADGVVTYRFTNGQTTTGAQVALANTPDPTVLRSTDGTYFTVLDGSVLPLGKPSTSGFGTIQGSSIELANVELSREFGDIVILQRGYQAASQVLNISSQLVEDLYGKLGGR